MNRIGIILAGGNGTRLRPVTRAISKHLIPVHDKPMIYYPLSILMLMGIKKILIVIKKNTELMYNELLGDGSFCGINIEYVYQNQANGIADGLLKCENKIKKNKICLILGDNIFYGYDLKKNFIETNNSNKNTIIIYKVNKPENYGVAYIKKNKIIKIIEKPKKYISDFAVTGIYFYENYIFKYLRKLKPSKRNELEITDLNNILIKKKKLSFRNFGRGFAWLDAGNFADLQETSHMISVIEKRQNLKIGCLEEIALFNKWVDKKKILKNKKNYINSDYGNYVLKLLK